MDNEQHAISLQEKLEFFFVGLVFTILGLSVQTFEPSRTDPWYYFDLGGWLLLFVSGVSGLVRLESMFEYFKFHARKDRTEMIRSGLKKRLDVATKLKAIGGFSQDTDDVERLITMSDEDLAVADRWIAKNEKKQVWSYHLAKWCFLGGLVAIFVSRTAPAVA